jgi:hypothetical protein
LARLSKDRAAALPRRAVVLCLSRELTVTLHGTVHNGPGLAIRRGVLVQHGGWE